MTSTPAAPGVIRQADVRHEPSCMGNGLLNHDADLGADPGRNNRFGYTDLRGFKCPAGAHARRANPRDALDHEMSVDVRLHRMLRLGTSYGPMLPEGVFEDDGADRGIIFVFAEAHPRVSSSSSRHSG